MYRAVIAFAAASFIIASPTRAGFVGLPLEITYYAEQSGVGLPTYDRVVDPYQGGNDFHAFQDGGDRTFDIDVGDASIRISNFYGDGDWNRLDFNGLIFSNGDDAPLEFTSFNLVASDVPMQGLDSSRLSYDEHNLKLNWSDLAFTPETVIELRVGFQASATDTSSVPTPIAAPAGLALIATLLIRRRRRAA